MTDTVRIPKRIAQSVLNSLKGGVVPRIGLPYIAVGRKNEIEALLRVNPHMEFLVYTLDFQCAASLPALFDHYGIGDTEVIQISVSKLNAKRNMVAEPAPWLITGQA